MAVSNDIRSELARLARSKRTRSSQFTHARPTHWEPANVPRPDSGEAFTPEGAWAFVADLLESKAEVETMILKKPPGKTGYVMLVDGWQGEKIYIKLQLVSGLVIGRSFHRSNGEDGDGNR